MLPEPLHPAVVHIPIALMLFLPVFALAALWAIRKGAHPRKAWGIVVALLGLLLVSAWTALQTGEQQEEIVEEVVAERYLESHEDAANAFLLLTGAVFVAACLGLARGRAGGAGRALGMAGTLILLAAGWRVGQTGGDLVYKHGAANAYISAGPPSVAEAACPDRDSIGGAEEDDEDER